MRANLLIVFVVFFVLSGCQLGGSKTLVAFTTDGCSDFPEGTLGHRDLWHRCCTAHDLRYWAGGTYAQRMQADLELRVCVQAVGEPAVAQLMLAGVRVGGSPWWPTRFRWGYGWPYGSGYSELTPAQLEQVRMQKEKQGLN